MTNRRNLLRYVGTTSIGLMTGYYIGAEKLLGFQSTEQPQSEGTEALLGEVTMGLVGHWPLDRIEEGTVHDESGNSHHGQVHGNPEVIDGRVGNALEFDGAQDFIEVGMTPELQTTGSFTMALWIRTTPQTGGTTFGMYTYNGSGRGEGQWIHASDSHVGISVRHSDGYGQSGASFQDNPYYRIPGDPPEIVTGNWTHVALRYDETAEQMSVFVDGTEVFSEHAPLEPRIDDSHLTIGARPHQNDVGDNFFEGAIDDVRLYHRSLSSNEIAYLAGVEGDENSPEELTEVAENEPECNDRRIVTDPSNPGHSWGGAPLISEGIHGPYELDLETRDSENREHYFGVCLEEGDSLSVTMQFTGPDLDMSIHSPETNDQHEQYESRPRHRKIAASESTSPNETANITANISGTHYIRTYIVSYGASGSYELKIEIE